MSPLLKSREIEINSRVRSQYSGGVPNDLNHSVEYCDLDEALQAWWIPPQLPPAFELTWLKTRSVNDTLETASKASPFPPITKAERWTFFACIIAILLITIAFHLLVAAKGCSAYRDQHIGTALEYAKGSIDLLRPITLASTQTTINEFERSPGCG